MKVLRKKIKLLLGVMGVCFILLTGYLVYDAVIWGNRWLNSPYNPRLQQQRATVTPGDIYDRTGELIVSTNDSGQRTYLENKSQRYAMCHIIGDTKGLCATGVESTYAATLLGYNASFLNTMKQFLEQTPVKGNDITLTADESLCTTAYKAMDGAHGAVILMNYKTGEILAMTSTPGFDPKNMDDADLSSESSVLVNRAIQGRYVPGSIFKVVTLTAALNNGITERWGYTCDGTLELEGDTITCPSEHGEQTLEEAFANSCNCAFAQLGVELGADKLVSTAQSMGFYKETMYKDFTLYASKLGITSDSRESEIGWAAIGQDKDTVTPMQMCMIAAGIANGGVVKEPRLVKPSALDVSNLTSALQDSRIMSAELAGQVKDMMRTVVEEGTGTRAAVDGVTVCGKTGTAEVGGSQKAHAWFIGFIEESEHPLAITVIVENGGSGGRVAAPIAQTVLEKAVEAGY